ncbi:hypothetical protein JB92DRAFT_3135158 [Gautieria morchelliformis]|nr:hypothetical protein JB92DRAFT_3135158 [Gautieria morchelliformis]
MDKWTTLEPTRLYASATTGLRSRAVIKPDPSTYIGRLPKDLHVLIITYLPVYQVPAYSRGNRALSRLTRDERVWEAKWNALLGEQEGLADVLDNLECWLEERRLRPELELRQHSLWTRTTSSETLHPCPWVLLSQEGWATFLLFAPNTLEDCVLKSLLPSLDSSPHLILSNLFPSPLSTLRRQSQTLHLLLLYLSPSVQPLRNWPVLRSSLQSAVDRFGASLLAAFEEQTV